MADTWIAVLASLGGLSFIGTLITAVASRRKVSADAVQVLSQTAAELVNPLRIELGHARVEIAGLRQGMTELGRHLDRVEEVLRHHQIPVPDRPPIRWPAANGRIG